MKFGAKNECRFMSSEGAISISDGNQNDLKFNHLEIPYSYSLQES
jgi:hypothetical protein